MQDGDSVRVKKGIHAGLIGQLVGEPGREGVAIKLLNTSTIVAVPYPLLGARTAEELLEPAPPTE